MSSLQNKFDQKGIPDDNSSNVKKGAAAKQSPHFPQLNIYSSSSQDNAAHMEARFPYKNLPDNKTDDFECHREALDSGIVSGSVTEEFSDLLVSDSIESCDDVEDENSNTSAASVIPVPQKASDIKIIVSEAVPDSGFVQQQSDDEAFEEDEPTNSATNSTEIDTNKQNKIMHSDADADADADLVVVGVSKINLDADNYQNDDLVEEHKKDCEYSEIEDVLNNENAWEIYYQQEDENGDTTLHLACYSGYAKVVAALLRISPNPCLYNIRNDQSLTALHLAVLTLQPNLVRMLVLAGADPEVRDRRGNTALHLAVKNHDKQCVRALTESFVASEIQEAHRQYGHRSHDGTNSLLRFANIPVNMELTNYDGKRCVHIAAETGEIEILRILTSHGADINAREHIYGRTPLHIAVDRNNDELLNFLLDECEDLDLEEITYAGLTPYQYALINQRKEITEILKKNGAEQLSVQIDCLSDDEDEDEPDYERPQFGDRQFFANFNGGGNPMPVT